MRENWSSRKWPIYCINIWEYLLILISYHFRRLKQSERYSIMRYLYYFHFQSPFQTSYTAHGPTFFGGSSQDLSPMSSSRLSAATHQVCYFFQHIFFYFKSKEHSLTQRLFRCWLFHDEVKLIFGCLLLTLSLSFSLSLTLSLSLSVYLFSLSLSLSPPLSLSSL